MPSLLLVTRLDGWLNPLRTYSNADDAPAECLVDVRPKSDEQSVWLIDDERSNLNRVLVAMASNRNAISEVGYVLFDVSVPAQFNIPIKDSVGGTPDLHANKTWHRDLVNLTVRQFAEFIVEIHRNGAKDQLLPNHTETLIRKGLENQDLDKAKVNSSLLKKLKL